MKRSIFFLLGVLCSFLLLLTEVHASTTQISVDTNMTPTSYNNCQGTSEPQETSLLLKTSCYNWKTGVRVDGPTKSVGSMWIMQSYTSTYDGNSYVITFDLTDEPPEPDTCTNGAIDTGEEGIDCGGPCTDACDAFTCPDGWESHSGVLVGEGDDSYVEDQCWPITRSAPNALGQCPQGTTLLHLAEGDVCDPNSLPAPTYFSLNDYTQEAPPETADVAVPSWDVSNKETDIDYQNESVVDNQDGTETATIRRTATDKDGKSSTLTVNVIRPSGSEPGTGFDGYSVAPGYEGNSFIGEETDGSDNPNNYNWDGTIAGLDEITGEIEEQTEKKDIMETIQGLFSNIPIVSAINDMTITVTNPTCVLNAGVFYGKELNIDFCRWESFLRSVGAMMVAFAQFSAIFIVIRGIK